MKRFIPLPATALALGLSTAHAAPPATLLCDANRTVNCVKDEIFIIDGNTQDENGIPLATNCRLEPKGDRQVPACDVSATAYADAAEYALGLARQAGAPDLSWDTVVVFAADFGLEAPRLIRNQGRDGAANRVRGIGLGSVAEPPAERPFLAHIVGGSTSRFGVFQTPIEAPPATLGKWPEQDPAGVEGYAFAYPGCGDLFFSAPVGNALCYDPLFNGYQALAQAVGHLHGPHLAKPTSDRSLSTVNPRVRGQDGYFVVAPQGRNSDVENKTGLWNSLFDLDGSLMGGNNWRNNGNGTIEMTLPSPHWAASPPYQGQRLLRFHPYDLYLMGLLPPEALEPVADYSVIDALETIFQNPRDGRPFPLKNNWGMLPGIGVKLLRYAGNANQTLVDEDRILSPSEFFAVNGLRDPPFENEIHFHRQLWIVITKPNDPEKTAEQINYMLRWRRAWNQYYYMLTSYLGRMVTTFDGKEDDSAYWEFAQAIDDEKTFARVGGLEAVFPGPLKAADSEVIESFVRLNTPGMAGALQFQPHANQLPIRIKGDQNHPGATNALIVRMRIPQNAFGPAGGAAFATVQLDSGVSLRLPQNPGAFLIPDGKWHDYSVDLSRVPDFVSRDHTGFALFPSNVPATNIDVDYVRFTWVTPEQGGDRDKDCAGKPQPDGFIDAADNCPDHFNPDQRDSNGDGVGDACEDVDQDGVVNVCDNCPVLTNSRQRDRNKNGLGDECDPGQGPGCFLQPESSIAGRHVPRSGFAALGAALVAGLALMLRRRRRR